MRALRGDRMTMIFKEPLTSLNPLHAIEKQIAEVLLVHRRMTRAQVRDRVVELLHLVGLPEAEHRLRALPHEFSGGQQQRVMIAIALANEPDLLIADEPTTALDVTIQAQILKLLKDLQARMHMGLLLITHDLAIVRQMVDRVCVMKAGEIVEQASRAELFARPQHPYTTGLLAAVPIPDPRRRHRQRPLAGEVPSPLAPPPGCPFHPRCPSARERCKSELPQLRALGGGSLVACHYPAAEGAAEPADAVESPAREGRSQRS
jgi:oligopeptide/dipeptide ABC transporter ATP-binding protein